MNYQLGSKNLVRLKICEMNLRMRTMKSEKLLKAKPVGEFQGHLGASLW